MRYERHLPVDRDAVHAERGLHVGRVGHAAQLDDDVVEGLRALEQRLHRRREVSCSGAADAPILQLEHLDPVPGVHGRASQSHGVHVDCRDVVDHHANAQATAVGEKVRERGGLAGAKKAAEQRRWWFWRLRGG